MAQMTKELSLPGTQSPRTACGSQRGTGLFHREQIKPSTTSEAHYLFTVSQIYLALIGIVSLPVAIGVSFAVTTRRLPK